MHVPVKENRWREIILRKLRLVACVKKQEEPEIAFVVFIFTVPWMWASPAPGNREVGGYSVHPVGVAALP